MGSATASRAATGYTLILSDASRPQGLAHDFLLSDDGVLYASAGGAAWRCLGLVDPEELLDDLGVLDGSDVDLTIVDVPPKLESAPIAM